MLESILHFLHSLYDPEGLKQLISWGGPALVCTIIFVETGLFVGFFLPGDSLLVTAGIFAGQQVIPLRWLLLPGILCAIAGDQLGYWIGRSAGPALYRREDSLFFRRSHLQRAHEFYEKYGAKTIVIARFVPVVRTFAPFVAGVGSMSYPRFLAYSVSGSLCWVGLFLGAGYYFGNMPLVRRNFSLVILAIIVISVIPAVMQYFKARRAA